MDALPYASVNFVALSLSTVLVQFVTILMTKPICKVCGLTLQGTDKEGEDICVNCLADLCFPSSNYNIKEGCIRQSLNIPLTDKESDDEQCQ